MGTWRGTARGTESPHDLSQTQENTFKNPESLRVLIMMENMSKFDGTEIKYSIGLKRHN